jgi:predicted  nucleic acid-binding Zn-ribbon protein
MAEKMFCLATGCADLTGDDDPYCVNHSLPKLRTEVERLTGVLAAANEALAVALTERNEAQAKFELLNVAAHRFEEEARQATFEVERLNALLSNFKDRYSADTGEIERLRLALLVAREMRFWQKRYFKDRTQSALTESKRLEKELDRVLAEVFYEQRQMSL